MNKWQIICPVIAMLIVGLVVTISAIPSLTGDWSYDEVARVPSPSGKVDAVLVEGNGGATASFSYYLCIVPRGKEVSGRPKLAVAGLYGAIRNQSAYGVDLEWEGADRLACKYLAAQESQILVGAPIVAGQQISIALRSNVNNSAAPSGGMLYNLRNTRP